MASGYEHFLRWGMAERRDVSVYFNEAYYAACNPDVAAAVAGGAMRSGLEHFLQFGALEGRYGIFDEAAYLSTYVDVGSAVQSGALPSGLWHFVNYGAAEQRAACPFFERSYYMASNPGVLPTAWGGQYASPLDHYIRAGAAANLRGGFDSAKYLAMYPDIANAVRTRVVRSALEHYLLYGRAEGRAACPYYVESDYLSLNPDIASAVSAGILRSGLEHYLRYGQYEGRRAVV